MSEFHIVRSWKFSKKDLHFKEGMVTTMKNWKKLMAGFCVAAMLGSVVAPVWAADDAAEEEADGDVAGCIRSNVGSDEGQCGRYLRIL